MKLCILVVDKRHNGYDVGLMIKRLWVQFLVELLSYDKPSRYITNYRPPTFILPGYANRAPVCLVGFKVWAHSPASDGREHYMIGNALQFCENFAQRALQTFNFLTQ